MITETVKLTETGLAKIAEKVKAANKIAKRAGLASVSYKVIGSEDRVIKINGDDYKVTFYEVVVTGEEVKVDGWEFVASIEHTENGNILHSKSEQNVPEQYRTTDSRLCEVCHTNRERKQTYLLCKDGQYKQVGSSCLKDFFGVNVNAVAKMYDEFFSIGQIMGEDEDMDEYISGGGRYEISLIKYLTYTLKAIAKFGYVSRKNSNYEAGQPATTDMVDNYLCDIVTYQATDEEIEAAKQLIIEAKAHEFGNSDYEWNLKVILENEYIGQKSYGYAASLPAYIGRVKEQERKASLVIDQTYFGTVGEKVEVSIKVLAIKELSTQWGTTWLYKMVNDAGQIFTWFGVPEKMHEDHTATVKGTIKAHVQFNGEFQTQLTRCKVSNEN
jgi:hypothetical protein